MDWNKMVVLGWVCWLAGCPATEEPDAGDDGASSESGSEGGSESGSESGSDSGSESGSASESESESGSSSESGTIDPGDPGLFACSTPVACHVDGGESTSGEVVCAGQAVVADVPVHIFGSEIPGDAQCGTQWFIVLLGEGKALLQTRECLDSDVQESDAQWGDASAQQSCDVELADGLAEACEVCNDPEKCSGCQWDPWPGDCGEGCTPGELANCEPIETPYDCDSVAALLAG